MKWRQSRTGAAEVGAVHSAGGAWNVWGAWITAGVTTLVLGGAGLGSAQESITGARAVVNARSLNLRDDSCGPGAPVLGSIPRGSEVTLRGEPLGGWVQVEVVGTGAQGCVALRYLDIVSAPESAASSGGSMGAEPDPYSWTAYDEEGAELLAEMRQLEADAAAADAGGDLDEAEDLRAEAAELATALDDRRLAWEEERVEVDLAAQEAKLEAAEEAERAQMNEGEEHGRMARRTQHEESARTRDWTGFYLGLSLSWGSGDEAEARNNLGTIEEDIDGIDGGLQLGYTAQFGKFVLGGEADYQVSGQSGELELAPLGFPGSTLEDEYESYWTARVRAGVGLSRAFVYGTGGYAHLDYERSFSGPISELTSDVSVDFDGWVFGAGAEFRLAEHMSVKGEVLYHEFDDEPEIVDVEFVAVRAGVNWRF